MLPPLEAYEAQINAALHYSGGTHTFSDVRDAVQAGRLKFWPGPQSVILTETIQYPRKRILNFFLAGGTLPEIKAMYPLIIEWARGEGCTGAVISGRAGWLRSFLTRTEGWESTLVVLERDLTDGEER
jgi:hypothetical protein